MKFLKTSNLYSLNKSTYVNLRWIAYIGQISAILIVQFFLEYNPLEIKPTPIPSIVPAPVSPKNIPIPIPTNIQPTNIGFW